jgi:hypothetical protein
MEKFFPDSATACECPVGAVASPEVGARRYGFMTMNSSRSERLYKLTPYQLRV